MSCGVNLVEVNLIIQVMTTSIFPEGLVPLLGNLL